MKKHSTLPNIITLILTASVIAVTVMYIFRPTEEPDQITIYMIGQLFGGWLVTLNYWFGSTRKDLQADIDKPEKTIK